MTDRTPPPGYEPPAGTPRGNKLYYLEPQGDYQGVAPQFMVMCRYPEGHARILAERCFTEDAKSIVDAMRLAYILSIWGTA